MAADALASLFGFSLPEIDYSGVNGLASSGEDAADALGECCLVMPEEAGEKASLNVIFNRMSGGWQGLAGDWN